MDMTETTEKRSCNCECLSRLMSPQKIPGKKSRYHFVDAGYIEDTRTGEAQFRPVLRGLKETPSGRRTVDGTWMPLKFCPVCGTEVEAWKEPSDD